MSALTPKKEKRYLVKNAGDNYDLSLGASDLEK
jgi:hypothetical protein